MRALRLYLTIVGGLGVYHKMMHGSLSPEACADTIVQAAQLFALVYLPWKALRAICRKPGHLDTVLFYWPRSGDPFTVADLCRSILILGSIGSGKTSSSGKLVARSLLASGAGIIVFGSKPEDLEMWRGWAEKAGRSADFKVFGPDTDLKTSILTEFVKQGLDVPGVVEELRDISTTALKSKGGGESAEFWEISQTAELNHTITPLMLAFGVVRAADIRKMIAFAPKSRSCVQAKEGEEPPAEYLAYHQGFHHQVMQLAKARLATIQDDKKRSLAAHDYTQAVAFWRTKYCTDDPKTRSNIDAGVLGLLDVFLRGVVFDKLATESNTSAADLENGAVIFVDFSPSQHGASGRFICTALKRHVQAYCLRRSFKPGDRIIALWSDECQRIVDPKDALFIDEARSHGSALVYLSQSTANFRMALGEENADALLGQFGHTCFHALDPTSAKYASERIGSAMQETISGDLSEGDVFEQMQGRGFKFSFQQGIRAVVEPRAFFLMRTGGASNRLKVDGYVVKTGTPFKSNGSNVIKCEFTQKG